MSTPATEASTSVYTIEVQGERGALRGARHARRPRQGHRARRDRPHLRGRADGGCHRRRRPRSRPGSAPARRHPSRRSRRGGLHHARRSSRRVSRGEQRSERRHRDALQSADSPAIRIRSARQTRSRMPACETFLVDVLGARTGSERSGPSAAWRDRVRFRQGPGYRRQVALYPTERRAGTHGFFELVGDRRVEGVPLASSTARSLVGGVEAGARRFLRSSERSLDRHRGDGGDAAAPRVVGDERVLYLVTADLNPLRDAQRSSSRRNSFGSAGVVSLYTFSAVGGRHAP